MPVQTLHLVWLALVLTALNVPGISTLNSSMLNKNNADQQLVINQHFIIIHLAHSLPTVILHTLVSIQISILIWGRTIRKSL
jgi:hypothetical protein